jgi:4-amino-4-deoxy-L-arabinose transferase-like glycosyltransferase
MPKLTASSPARTGSILIPGAVFLVLLATAFTGDYFRDEFYYLACRKRMAWGYVDQPPFSIAVLWIVTRVFGDSLVVLRALSAGFITASVYLTGVIARRFGGGPRAQTVAMTAAAIAPMWLSLGSFYSMNAIDVFLWTAAALALVDVLDRPSWAGWLWLGAILGCGLLNKISVLWLGAGIGAGLLLTSWRLIGTRGPWLAGAVASVMFLPHVLWQVVNQWPTLEFIRNASENKMQVNAPLALLADQITGMHPFGSVIWIIGLVVLLFSARLRPYRVLAVAYLVVLLILIANRTSRSGYLAASYAPLLAAGGVAIEVWLTTRVRQTALLAVLVIGGLIALPLAIPLLSPNQYVAYAAALGSKPSTEEKKDLARLPQFFADRQGWRAMVSQIEAVADRLSPAERDRAVVLTGNYGEAGAVELLGQGRLAAISGHNNYWLWGPGRASDIFIVLSRSRERQEARFLSVETAGVISCGDCMPYENGLTIFIGRGLKLPLDQLWRQLKHFD